MRARCSGGSPGACGGPCRAVWPRAGSRRERQVQQELGGQKAEGGASWDVPTGAAMGVLHIRASSTPSSSMAPQNVDPWTLRSDVQARATQTRDGTWTRGPAFLPVPRGDPEPRGQAAPCVGPVHMHAGLGCTRARSRRPPPGGRSVRAAPGPRHAAPLQPAAPSARACGPAFLPLPQDAASQGAVPLGAPHAPGDRPPLRAPHAAPACSPACLVSHRQPRGAARGAAQGAAGAPRPLSPSAPLVAWAVRPTCHRPPRAASPPAPSQALRTQRPPCSKTLKHDSLLHTTCSSSPGRRPPFLSAFTPQPAGCFTRDSRLVTPSQ